MRKLTWILSAILLTLISTRVAAMEKAIPREAKAPKESQQVCKIVTGYGIAIGHGANEKEAKEQARYICGSKLIDQYLAQRREIPESAKEDLALACINLECQ